MRPAVITATHRSELPLASRVVPQVLWLTNEEPHFTISGGSIRQANLLSGVAERADVHLRMIGRLTDDRVRERCASVREVPWTLTSWQLPRVRRWLRFAMSPHPDHVFAARLRRRLLVPYATQAAQYDVVNVEHIEMGPLHNGAPTRWVLDLHNLLSVRARQQRAVIPSRKGRVFWRSEQVRAQRLERQLAATYDEVVVCSPEDANILGGRASLVGNGVDLSRFTPSPLPAAPVVVMTAHLGYLPNIDAVEWLAEVAPHVREHVPDTRFVIVGREPHHRVRTVCREASFELHADVPSVVPFLEEARVALVPLRVGSGTRLKALEAMAAGRPMVGTSIGLEGLGVVPDVHAIVADRSDEMARGIIRLLTDDEVATTMAAASLQLAASADWERIGREYARVLLDPVT